MRLTNDTCEKELFMDQIKIHSNLYDYTVDFTDDFSEQIESFSANTVYVIDRNVYKFYEDKFSAVPKAHIYLMDAVEEKKNMDTVMDIMGFFQRLHIHKDWKVVCFGGGITQDVTTTASYLYLRNVNWYLFPTTLLSMSDSCIGGKSGLNFKQVKNQIGVFYPPKKIFIDTHFISTLTRQDYLNGWGEILKFSLTESLDFYHDLKNEKHYIPCENIAAYIHRGLSVKKKIIETDEFDLGIRKVLNYGHTFGHALEAYTDNAIPHGMAVIWGIDVVNYIAVQENVLSKEFYLDVKRLIHDSFLIDEIQVDNPERIIDLVKSDKKVVGNKVSLAVPDGTGKLILHPMEINQRFIDCFKGYLIETHEYYCN